MGRILRRTALAGIAALAMGLIAAPGAWAQAPVT